MRSNNMQDLIVGSMFLIQLWRRAGWTEISDNTKAWACARSTDTGSWLTGCGAAAEEECVPKARAEGIAEGTHCIRRSKAHSEPEQNVLHACYHSSRSLQTRSFRTHKIPTHILHKWAAE